jgi:hypothetical protein
MKNSKTALIITSIAAPNAVLKSCAEDAGKNNVDFIVIGDTKSPDIFELNNCRFYSVAEQQKLDFRLGKLLPFRHYSRKNIGYLLAKKHDVIIETDDDNFPREEFWYERKRRQHAEIFTAEGWLNVYSLFTDNHIWPRGFPVELLSSGRKNHTGKEGESDFPIQQGLADENPDVDAVYRMTMKLPVSFEKRLPVATGVNTWCPFNSQNTTWFKDAFPLMYLPSFCSFRMTDIWRSFIAQRIAWTCDWPILFHNATVWQERNEHNLLKDFEDEVPGYMNNSRICKLLEDLDLRNGKSHIFENLYRCYSMMTENNFIGREELPLVDAWIKDLEK